MIKGQELNIALGEPVLLTGFSDNQPRLCYPYKLKDFYKLTSYLSFVDMDSFDNNFKSKESIVSLQCLFKDSFKDCNTLDVMKVVMEKQFFDVINDIRVVNGLDVVHSNKEIEIKQSQQQMNQKDAIDWDVSVSAVSTYTGNSVEDIKNMTFGQFQSLLKMVGKRLNYEFKTNTISSVEKPSEYIKEDEHPLYSDGSKKNYMTMSDLEGFKTRG